jgi:uncharacterized protein
MSVLPKMVNEAWKNRDGAIVLTTVDAEGVPNAIFATCVKKIRDDAIVICDNYFHKTRANIAAGSKGSLLFITNDKKAFQLKGSFEYLTEGELFDNLKDWVEEKHPKIAAVVLHVEDIFSGAEKLT